MLLSEDAYRAVLNVELPLCIVNKRRSGKGEVTHGFVFGVVASLGVTGLMGGLAVGLGAVLLAGKYSAPVCPQAAKVSTTRARAICLTRIWAAFNIPKL